MNTENIKSEEKSWEAPDTEHTLFWWRETLAEGHDSESPLPIVFYRLESGGEVKMECTVKWDGCSDWHPTDGNFHFCDPVEMMCIFGRIHQIAQEELDGDISHMDFSAFDALVKGNS